MTTEWSDRWNVATFTYDERPMTLRYRTLDPSMIETSRYPDRIGIAIPDKEPDEDGFPTAAELSRLDEIEDAILPRLEEAHESLCVLIITGKKMREFVFYTSNADGARKKVANLRKSIRDHELQMIIERDPKWKVYHLLVERATQR